MLPDYWQMLLSEYDDFQLDPVLLAPVASAAGIPLEDWESSDAQNDDWVRAGWMTALWRILAYSPDRVLECYARHVAWTLHVEDDREYQTAMTQGFLLGKTAL
jgi:hypothetical protein